MQVRYEGTLELEGDFRRPGETRSYDLEQRFRRWPDGRVQADWTTWSEGDTARIPESFLVCGDSVFHRDTPDAQWVLLAGRRSHQGLLQALAGLPEELGRVTNDHKAEWRAELSGESARLDSFVERWAHPRLGDVADSIVYTWKDRDVAPTILQMVLHERDVQWHLDARLVSGSNEAPAESLACPPSAFTLQSGAPDRLIDEPKIVPLAPGVWLANMEDIGSRTLFVEFADHLALVEFAVGSSNGERLVDAARQRWPQKPVRYALFSHYHPHYLGGIRAMIAEGATVVTTPLNEALVRKIAALPFTIEPDRLARSQRPLKIQIFTDRFELADSANQLVAINYGAGSQHTDEFVVFWLPRAKLLFQSSLGWRGTQGTIRISGRVAPLLAWADEQKLDVDRVVQSWPMRGTAAEVARAELDSLVQAAKTR
jgi:glyoxylase-like metal-dependent hydrolase (beta-lactamase superfamily II)